MQYQYIIYGGFNEIFDVVDVSTYSYKLGQSNTSFT